ncbi:MAG: hypothetical protein KGP13_00375 [Burkholderiales bacterium]|nr:hypothetical protein [Burkholderiales bacterium]
MATQKTGLWPVFFGYYFLDKTLLINSLSACFIRIFVSRLIYEIAPKLLISLKKIEKPLVKQ